jgi:hypothetical protein
MGDGDEPDVANVAVELLGVEYTRKSGSLLAFVSFGVDIGGVVIRVQGAQIRSTRINEIELTAPQFKSSTGVWLPAIELPDSIMLSVLELIGPTWPPREGTPVMLTGSPPSVTFKPHVERRDD